MTNDEWNGTCLFIEQAFKGEFDGPKRSAYRFFLDDFSPEQIMNALKVLAEKGSPWLPAAPEIVKAIRDTQASPVPGWSEVWKAITKACKKRNERVALEWLSEEVHPVVAAFVSAEGWTTLKMTPFGDPEYGGLRQKELHERWDEFVAVATERLQRGLALSTGARRALGPQRLDQAALLPGLVAEAQRRVEQAQIEAGSED